jgi:hypothetical protein
MKVTIKGGLKRQREAIDEMVFWLGRTLLSRRLYAGIILNIEIKNLSHEDYNAATYVNQSEYLTNRPRVFDLEFSSKRTLEEIRTDLVHEMVHVKQYATGELYRYDRTDHIRWKDKIYPPGIEDGNNYWIMPYEVEARGQELGLKMKFREYLRGKK